MTEKRADAQVPTQVNAGNRRAGDAITQFALTTQLPSKLAAADRVVPTLLGTAPADEDGNVAPGANLVLIFSEAVRAGSGYIMIADLNGTDWRVIMINDTTQVSFSGNSVTINPKNDLAAGHRFEVTMMQGSISDMAGNDYVGLASDVLNFTTSAAVTGGDTIAGTVASTAVLAANGAGLSSSIDTVADQDWVRISLSAGVTYAFLLNKTGTSSLNPYLRLLDSAGKQLLVNDDGGGDSNALITYKAALSGTYYLSAQSANNATTGAYMLTAALVDTTAPMLTGRSPLDESGNVALGANIVLTFNETVRAGSGNIVITDLSNGIARAIAVTDTSQISFSSTNVTINPVNDLAAGHRFDVTLAAGVVKDVAGNNYGGLASGGLNFTTMAAMTGGDTIAGTMATAAALSANGVALSSNIDTPADQDWWRISLNAGTTYTFRMNKTATSSLDAYLRLIDSAGNQLLINNDGAGNRDALITYKATVGGTYYLSAQSASNATVGAYTLMATLIDAAAPTLVGRSPLDETGNVALGANIVLTFNETVRAGSGNIFITDLSNATVRTIAVTDTNQVSFSGNSLSINPTSDLAAGHRFDVTLAAGVVKDIVGNNYAGLASGGLNFTTVAAVAGVDTIAGTIATTAILVVNGVAPSGIIETVVDQDWWRISLTTGTTYAFRLNKAATSALDPYLRLLDSAGTLVMVNNDSGGNNNALITYTATADGNYYLAAQSASNATSGAYTLQATTLGDSVAPSLTSQSPADESVNVARGADIVLTFNETVRAGSGSIVITDLSTGTVRAIAASDAGQVSFSGNSVTINPASDLAAGHRFDVTLAEGVIKDVAGNNYIGLTTGALNFNTAPESDNDAIPGTTLTNAVLTLGTMATGIIDTVTDQDWWGVSLNAGSTYTFRLEKIVASSLDAYLRLLDSSGRQLLVDDEGGGNSNALITYTATASGTYYLSAQSFNNVTKGAYALTATNIDDRTAPILISRQPLDGNTDFVGSNNIALIFSETVHAGSGNIVITDLTSGSARVIAISDTSQVSFNGSTVVINPDSDLAPAHRFELALAAGIVKDSAGNSYAGQAAGTFHFNTAPERGTAASMAAVVPMSVGAANGAAASGNPMLADTGLAQAGEAPFAVVEQGHLATLTGQPLWCADVIAFADFG